MFANSSLITWPKVYKTHLCSTLKMACNEFDINIKDLPLYKNCDGNHHYELINVFPNTISWICYSRSQEEIKSNRNVIFFDKDLLDDDSYYYFDSNGYGSNSNIVFYGLNRKKYEDFYIKEVYCSLKNKGWELWTGNKKDGPIMIALQNNLEDQDFLIKCKKYLPKSKKIIVRGNPECYKFFEDMPNWELDEINNEFESLARCNCLVVNSHNIMFKALAMAIPTASCSRWFHSGSSSVFDCSRNESMLKYILDFRFEEKSSQNLICSIRENSISANIITIEELLRNSNFSNWLRRIIIP